MIPRPLSRRALWLGSACALVVLSIWTSFILVARFSAARTLTPFDIAFLRFLFSGLLVLPVLAWRWRALIAGLRLPVETGGSPGRPWVRGAALTLTAGVGYCALAYTGFFFAPAAHAAVLMPGSLPLWTAVFAVLLLGERLAPARLAGLFLIVAGGLLVAGSSLRAAAGGADTWKGDLLFLAAGACWSLYGVLCRRWRVGAVDATLAVAVGSLIGGALPYAVAVAAGLVNSHLALAPWREIAFQAVYQGGVTMLIAGLAYTQVVQTFGPLRTTMLTALVPVFAALAAVPLLGEPLAGAALAGLACVTAGLLFGLRSPRAIAPRLAEGSA
jgi:drug/metabolite transporter (DMT)-like permease